MLDFLGFPLSLSPRRSTTGQLRDRMEQDLTLKGVSPATIRNYLLYGRKFAAFYRPVRVFDQHQPRVLLTAEGVGI
jgi:hypothetical protein